MAHKGKRAAEVMEAALAHGGEAHTHETHAGGTPVLNGSANGAQKTSPAAGVNGTQPQEQTSEQVLEVFRRWGFLQSDLDPLRQYLAPEPFPVPEPTGAAAEAARRFYCGTIGVEFMHIPSAEKRQWIQAQMEREAPAVDQKKTLTHLIKADVFEQVIQSRYLGTKRFSLEGLTVLIPFLDRTFEVSAGCGVNRAVLAMSHRGRLNVMTNTIGRNSAEIFARFEDVDPRSTMGGGDVKYHQGATGEYVSPTGETIALHLVSNPSHLEAVDPVALGRARARQARVDAEAGAEANAGKQQVLPMVIHGDAAFAGQGVLAETLNMALLHGYNVGGTIQVIVNNLLGFTAVPEESNSSRFATDIAKRLPIPIFHVNAEDPDAVMRVAAIAAEYRHTFKSDVVVDLIGYRRHGHSEVDDPTVTSPKRYALIKDMPELYKSYAKRVAVDPAAEVSAVQQQFLDEQKAAIKAETKPDLVVLPDYWSKFRGGPLSADDAALKTGLDAGEVKKLADALCAYPADFNIHPKVKKLYEQRVEMGAGKRPFDHGFAELLAFASLVTKGTPVRLTGQDTQRGTFNQRHAVLVDTASEEKLIPLRSYAKATGGADFEVYNTLLSEAAVLGFEYGYSRDYPEALVLWEAQFGDFANGAQIIIDQFIAAGEAKWHLLSGIVMLLPHGYEGQGPEHSSARLERYLQLCAQDNMIVAQPSTAAQHFHLLRRQAMRASRKPLIVMAPKSMLRHPDASSTLAEFAADRFQNVIPDTSVKDPRRVLFCSGKIGHNLRVEREKRKDSSVGIVFVDQLYPWPEAEMQAALDLHPKAEVVWVQEEPANMGALSYVMPHLRRMARDRVVISVKRSASASPATGSAKAHDLEERALIDMAFGVSS